MDPSILLLFQSVLLLLNRFLDGCNFAVEGCDFFLRFCYLGCVVVISFGAVFAAFRSGHRDNLFPF